MRDTLHVIEVCASWYQELTASGSTLARQDCKGSEILSSVNGDGANGCK